MGISQRRVTQHEPGILVQAIVALAGVGSYRFRVIGLQFYDQQMSFSTRRLGH